MGVQRDMNEDGHHQPDRAWIDQGAVALDHPLLLQPLAAARNLAGGEADPFGERRVGEGGVVLQRGDKAPVEPVERDAFLHSCLLECSFHAEQSF